MNDHLYFPNNLKDIKYHIGLYNKLENLFTIKSKHEQKYFQRKCEIITILFLLQ